MTRDTKKAFIWIIGLLRKHKIPFYISGGFAANIYGPDRLLMDIDIEIPDEQVFEIQNVVKKYIVYGPKRYKDKEFDLLLMTLKYSGQEIDICGASSSKLYDRKIGEWISQKIDLSKATRKKVYNHIVPVIPSKDLINYKRKISRRVDVRDVGVLSE